MERILLVEDDAALGRGICMALENADVTMTLCGTLAEARETLAAERFSLLILDINLSDGSGRISSNVLCSVSPVVRRRSMEMVQESGMAQRLAPL